MEMKDKPAISFANLIGSIGGKMDYSNNTRIVTCPSTCPKLLAMQPVVVSENLFHPERDADKLCIFLRYS